MFESSTLHKSIWNLVETMVLIETHHCTVYHRITLRKAWSKVTKTKMPDPGFVSLFRAPA
eukprot:UN18982